MKMGVWLRDEQTDSQQPNPRWRKINLLLLISVRFAVENLSIYVLSCLLPLPAVWLNNYLVESAERMINVAKVRACLFAQSKS